MFVDNSSLIIQGNASFSTNTPSIRGSAMLLFNTKLIQTSSVICLYATIKPIQVGEYQL